MGNNTISNVIILFLASYWIISLNSTLFCQNDTLKTQEVTKPRIIFNNSKTENIKDNNIVHKDSTHVSKILFSKNPVLDSKRIELLSEYQYKVENYNYMVGDNGINLKESMKDNLEAVKKVDHAYSKRKTGLVLMILGGVVAAAGVALSSTWVETNEETHGNYKVTYYWFPGVTIGAILGGIGYSNYTSTHKGLSEAVDYYNSGL